MTQDEIIEMAEQTGFEILYGWPDSFYEFAKLVEERTAAKEREACAKVCDDIDKSHWGCEVRASWCSEAIRVRSKT